MNDIVEHTYKLIEGEHFNMEICFISGCDYIPYMQSEIDDWLIDNMEGRYVYKGVSRYVDNYKNVRIVFNDKEDLMAFKLRWE